MQHNEIVLFDAIQKGCIDTVRQLIHAGVNVNAYSFFLISPLHCAVAKKNLPIVQLLIESGAQLYNETHGEDSILHYAAAYSSAEIVEFLLETGARGMHVDARTEQTSQTPLHCAAREGNFSEAQLLIKKGANVNATRLDYTTPLHEAAHNGHTAIVKLLLEHDARASINQWNDRNFTPFHEAVAAKHLDICALLLEHGAYYESEPEESTEDECPCCVDWVAYDALPGIESCSECSQYYASHKEANVNGDNNPGCIAYLVGHGVLNAQVDDEGNRFLHRAIAAGNFALTKCLIEQGANIDVQNNHGYTPLHIATYHNNLNLIALLCKHGANLEINDIWGRTPLIIAASLNHLDSVQLLMMHGAQVNAATMCGWSPLFYAVCMRSYDITKFLLEHGANVLATIYGGWSIMHYAVLSNSSELTQLLIEHGADLNTKNDEGKTPLHGTLDYGNKDIAKLLIAHGVDINAPSVEGFTPLHYAVRANDYNTMKFLIEQGADVNAKNTNKEFIDWTPLHIAAEENDDSDIVKLLLEHGAQVNAKDRHGYTPLHVSAEENDNTRTTKLLLEHGADVHAKTDYCCSYVPGETPLDKAMLNDDMNIAMCLVEYGANSPLLLHHAIRNKHEEIATRLIEHYDADINAPDDMGFTPLHLAAAANLTFIVPLLLARGANPDAKDPQGFTPLLKIVEDRSTDYIYGYHYLNYDLFHALFEHSTIEDLSSAEKTQLLCFAIYNNYETIAKILLSDYKADINAIDVITRLSAAILGFHDIDEAESGCEDRDFDSFFAYLTALIKYGAQVNAPSERGFTPLHHAVSSDSSRTVEFLIEHGADVNAQDDSGQTPLDVSIKSGNIAMQTCLIEHGAKDNRRRWHTKQLSAALPIIGQAEAVGPRQSMEDRTVAIPSFLGNPKDFFVGLFDGHGGAHASQYAQNHLHEQIARMITGIDPSDTAAIIAAITDAVLAIDKKIIEHMNDGSTAICALYYSGYLYIGNLGDSRAVFSSPGQALFATVDHKPENPLEKARIEKAGATVRNNRIYSPINSLAVARAFGDRYFKEHCGLSAEPDVVVLSPEHITPESILILACDGIWEVMSNDEAVTIVLNVRTAGGNPTVAAQALIQEATKRESGDNISALVVYF